MTAAATAIPVARENQLPRGGAPRRAKETEDAPRKETAAETDRGTDHATDHEIGRAIDRATGTEGIFRQFLFGTFIRAELSTRKKICFRRISLV